MGHIDLARFIFYKGAYGPYGREIDAIARRRVQNAKNIHIYSVSVINPLDFQFDKKKIIVFCNQCLLPLKL
jgi:hypothetical protein